MCLGAMTLWPALPTVTLCERLAGITDQGELGERHFRRMSGPVQSTGRSMRSQQEPLEVRAVIARVAGKKEKATSPRSAPQPPQHQHQGTKTERRWALPFAPCLPGGPDTERDFVKRVKQV
uniref:Putative secreted protein n=1 Tax=Anopheles triannulatus TaxID=58253 RepID=A0A2M4B7C6_9DIPT